MQIKRATTLTLIALSFICLAIGTTYGQTRRRANTPATTPTRAASPSVQKRRVILDLVGQGTIDADFIQADATSVTAEINGVQRVFKMSEVVAVIFSPDEAEKKYPQTTNTQEPTQTTTTKPIPCPAFTPEQKELISGALDEMERTSRVASLDAVYTQTYYNAMLVAWSRTNKAAHVLPDCELKKLLVYAIAAYQDALSVATTDNPNTLLDIVDRYKLQDVPSQERPKKILAYADTFRNLASKVFSEPSALR